MISQTPAIRRTWVSGLLFATAIIAVMAFFFFTELPISDWFAGISAESIKHLVESWGEWGVVAAVLLMVLHSFVPFPAEFAAIANGMCFGLIWGTVITWVGAMLGAVLAFALSRRLGRPLIERLLNERHLDRIDKWIVRYGADGLFISRFIPVIAFNLINYAAGLTRIPYWTFLWTTGLGILPMTILMVMLGSEIHDLPITTWLVIATGCFASWLLLTRLVTRRHLRPNL